MVEAAPSKSHGDRQSRSSGQSNGREATRSPRAYSALSGWHLTALVGTHPLSIGGSGVIPEHWPKQGHPARERSIVAPALTPPHLSAYLGHNLNDEPDYDKHHRSDHYQD
jgi:hypothetical protein